jgi:hypothetical protein
MMGIVLFTFRMIVFLLLLVLVFMTWGLCRAASERDRAEEELRKRLSENPPLIVDDWSIQPMHKNADCFIPNNSAHPLCKGNGSEECQYCCLYEHFPEPPFDK